MGRVLCEPVSTPPGTPRAHRALKRVTPAYVALALDELTPWPLEPCAKRLRASADDAGHEHLRPWGTMASANTLASQEEPAGAPSWEPVKRRRLDASATPPTAVGTVEEVPSASACAALETPADDNPEEGPSTWSWGDLSKFLEPVDAEISTADASEPMEGCEVEILQRPSCTSLVPYRHRRAQAMRIPLLWEPRQRLSVAEVHLRDDMGLVLPDFAAAHRASPGAEEVVVPYSDSLAIVLYKGGQRECGSQETRERELHACAMAS